jgi:hypothetical protein
MIVNQDRPDTNKAAPKPPALQPVMHTTVMGKDLLCEAREEEGSKSESAAV